MLNDIRSTLARQKEIDILSYAVMLGLIGVVVVMGYATLTGVNVSRMLLLQDTFVRVLVLGCLFMFILHLADQRRRLRAAIVERDAALTRAHADLMASVERLSFALHTAEVMATRSGDDAVMSVLVDLASYFGADAAALVAEDVSVFSHDPDAQERATADIIPIATQCVGARKPLSIAITETGSCVMAVPLRVHGRLRHVCSVWRENGRFDAPQLEGLVLVARIMELGLEGETTLAEARAQMRSTADAIARALDPSARRGDVPGHVAPLADAVADRLGMDPLRRETLRIAALLRDVGLPVLPSRDGQYPSLGAVLSACAAWHQLESEDASAEGDAAAILRQKAGSVYDPSVVTALLDVVSAPGPDPARAVAAALVADI